jgi:alpha-L-fucosidase 2
MIRELVSVDGGVMAMAVSRRELLRGASGLAGGAALGGLWSAGSPAARAAAENAAEDTAENAAGNAAGASAAPDRVVEEIVRDAQMVWRRPPTSWQTGPFLGNGFLGVQVYQVAGSAGNVLRFTRPRRSICLSGLAVVC